jgi:hypothetical protein
MTEIKVFIDQLPNKDKECCSNCTFFYLGGVSTGHCTKNNRDKQSGQKCKKFEKESEEQKLEKML